MASRPGLLEVRITAPDDHVAERLARLLVERRLAACVQTLPQVSAIYTWRGEIETATEVLMLAKTHSSRFQGICDLLGAEHPYDTPEVIAVPIVDAAAAYAAWLAESVDAFPGHAGSHP